MKLLSWRADPTHTPRAIALDTNIGYKIYNI